MGCELDLDSGMVLFGDHFCQPLGVEADHDLFSHHNGWSSTALVPHQFAHRAWIATNIAQFVCNASLREEGLRPVARRSTRLAEKQDAFLGHTFRLSEPNGAIADCPSLARDGSTP